MQISTPTQAPNSFHEGSFAEKLSGDSPIVLDQTPQKKGKPGFFEKLLEGLTGKNKKTGPEAVKPEDRRLKFKGQKTDAVVDHGLADLPLGFKHLTKAGEGPEKAEEGAASLTAKLPTQEFQDFFESINETEKGGFEASWTLSKPVSLAGKDSRQNNTANTLRQMNQKETFDSASTPVREEGRTIAPEPGNNSEGKAKNQKSSGISGSERFLRDFAGAQNDGQRLSGDNSVRDPGFLGRLGQTNLRPENGERDNSRLSELRAKKGRPNIEVRDLRTTEAREADAAVSKETVFSTGETERMEIELPVNLSLSAEDKQDSGRTGTGREANFEDALARELRGDLSNDIVRDASIIVRNGGTGTIRLSLHPESLGNVKIRLEMTENKITGHIVVESSEALRAFERELPVLEKAFRDSGFGETALDMFLAQDNTADGGDSGYRDQRQEGDFPAVKAVYAASGYDAGSAAETSGTGKNNGIGAGGVSGMTGTRTINMYV